MRAHAQCDTYRCEHSAEKARSVCIGQESHHCQIFVVNALLFGITPDPRVHKPVVMRISRRHILHHASFASFDARQVFGILGVAFLATRRSLVAEISSHSHEHCGVARDIKASHFSFNRSSHVQMHFSVQ